MIEEKDYHSAVNRLYYACFYAISALLIKYNIQAGTHHGAKSQFGEHFIMTERVARKYGVFYSQLFNSRNEGDYDDFVYFDEDIVSEYRKKTTEFLRMINEEISKNEAL